MGFFSSIKKLWSTDKQKDSAQNTADNAALSQNYPDADWRKNLGLSLRKAEPRLSVWLNLTLEGIDKTGADLWERLEFLLKSLDAPEEEAKVFVNDFRQWTENMEYSCLEDFRSELMYRLALALDLEDEKDERDRLFCKLQSGLRRTREQFGKGLQFILGKHLSLSDNFWDELEELFILSDMGAEAAAELLSRLKKRTVLMSVTEPAGFVPIIEEEFTNIFKIQRQVSAVNLPETVLVIGVNGAGKTTTIAKLAYRAKLQGKKTLLIAADTFRAAAVDQLKVWAERAGVDFYAKQEGSDPASVAFEGMDKALQEKYDIVFIDTAGRLHTKNNLVEELKKISRITAKKHPGAPHRNILVMDAGTGQNALSQAKIFKEQCAASEIILTKLDGTAKGGMAVAIALKLKIPITFMGFGEGMEDLRPFDAEAFAKAIIDEKSSIAV